jgi:hypothetical protein
VSLFLFFQFLYPLDIIILYGIPCVKILGPPLVTRVSELGEFKLVMTRVSASNKESSEESYGSF